MQIPKKVWQKYKTALAAVDQKAAAEMDEYIRSLGEIDSIPWSAVQYAAALTDVYGEAAGAAACEMYDATAAASGAKVKPAEMAELPKIGEVAKVVKGAYKNGSEKVVPGAVGRLVKQVGADTTLKNAQRDGAEFAWIPAGDTCAFCLMLASRGWQKISKKSLKNGHAEHIHANCDCAYCVRFDKNTTVEGYEPEKYREIYENAEGSTPEEKINSMRREAEAAKRKDTDSTLAQVPDAQIPKFLEGDFEDFDDLILSEGERNALNQLRYLSDKDNFEHLVLDYGSSFTAPSCSSKHDSVEINLEGIDNSDIKVYHSHTNDTLLSTRDLKHLTDERVSVVGVVTKNGDVFTAEIGNGYRPTEDEFDEAQAEIDIIANDNIFSMYPVSELSFPEINYLYIREKAFITARKFGWTIRGGKLNG